MIIATYMLLDLTEFVVGVEIFVGFYKVKRYVQGNLFAGNGNAVADAGLPVEFLGFVQIIGTVQKSLDFAVKGLGIIGGFDNVCQILEQDRFDNVVEAFHNGVVRRGTTPYGSAEEQCVGEIRFGASVKESDGAGDVCQRKPLADGYIDGVLYAKFRKLSNNGHGVRRKGHLLDFVSPGRFFFF